MSLLLTGNRNASLITRINTPFRRGGSGDEKMLFYIITAIIFVIAILLEASFLAVIFPHSILPDLVMVMVIMLGFLMREKRGAAIGLLGGLLQDVLLSPALGIYAISKLLLGLGAGLVGREVYRDRFFGPVLLVFIGTYIHELLIFMLLTYSGETLPLGWSMTGSVYFLSILNTISVLLLYPAMFWIYRQRGYLGIYTD